MAAFVGGDLGEHRPQAHFEEARNRRRDFHAPQVQPIGPLQQQHQLALDVKEGRHYGSYRLAVQGNEVARCGQRTAHRRLRLVDYKPVDSAILEWALAGEAALLAAMDGFFDGADFPLAHHGEVRQALLDGPFQGRRTPVKAGLVEFRGESAGLLLNLFKLPAIEFEFGNGHSRDYSEDGAIAGGKIT